ncbi:hypothetical protein Dip510_000120 [Elusimicrobium posterum]|uniref:hypothetical protein n=1 Tax=Elusimicrobium posterum TaxID=3116653 RepID=UPI003C745EDC
MKKILTLSLALSFFINLCAPANLHANEQIKAFTKIHPVPNTAASWEAMMAHRVHMNLYTLQNTSFNIAMTKGDVFATLAPNEIYTLYGEFMRPIDEFNRNLRMLQSNGVLEEVTKILEKDYSKEHSKFMRKYYSPKGSGGYSTTPMRVEDIFNKTEIKKMVTFTHEYNAERLGKLSFKAHITKNSNLKISPDLPAYAETAKAILRRESTLPELLKIMYPEVSAIEMQDLARLNRAYLQYLHALNEVKVANQIAGKNIITRLVLNLSNSNYKSKKAYLKRAEKNLKAAAKDKSVIETFNKTINSERISQSSKSFLGTMRSTLTNIGTLTGMVVVGVVLSNTVQAAADRKLKEDINNLTAEVIKNKSALTAAVKETPELLPILSIKDQENILSRRDLLTGTEMLDAALIYQSFVKDVKTNTADWRNIMAEIKKSDLAEMQRPLTTEINTFEKYGIDKENSKYKVDAASFNAWQGNRS